MTFSRFASESGKYFSLPDCLLRLENCVPNNHCFLNWNKKPIRRASTVLGADEIIFVRNETYRLQKVVIILNKDEQNLLFKYDHAFNELVKTLGKFTNVFVLFNFQKFSSLSKFSKFSLCLIISAVFFPLFYSYRNSWKDILFIITIVMNQVFTFIMLLGNAVVLSTVRSANSPWFSVNLSPVNCERLYKFKKLYRIYLIYGYFINFQHS